MHNCQLPTIRLKNVIHSADSGSILTVPRERGYVRYVPWPMRLLRSRI